MLDVVSHSAINSSGRGGLFLPGRVFAEDRPRALILAHYMRWFESKPISGQWGWYWTMNHFDPEVIDRSGRRSIASHDYPMVGPYDSADPDLLEYHTLLRKVAGVDGVIAETLDGFRGDGDFDDRERGIEPPGRQVHREEKE